MNGGWRDLRGKGVEGGGVCRGGEGADGLSDFFFFFSINNFSFNFDRKKRKSRT